MWAVEQRSGHPAGQLVALSGGNLVGSLYSQTIPSEADIRPGATFRSALALHRDGGQVLQLLSVQVRSDRSTTGLGDLLVRHALEQARLAGLEVAVAVGRCRVQAGRSEPSRACFEAL